MTRGRVVAVMGAVLALLCGCSGIPDSSDPQTIQPIDVDEGQGSVLASPQTNIDPRTLVQDFLTTNPTDPVNHRVSRQYLTRQADADWSDKTATIISAESVGIYKPNKPITVRGRVVGTLNSAGIFVPSLQGTGSGGALQTFTYRLTKVNGQNRISSLPDGLVLTTHQFEHYYHQHALYFFDTAHRYLVPDSRWSALTGTHLDTWLMGQLASGPRAELRNTVSTDVLPVQANSPRITVKAGPPIKVEIPGASQLAARAKRRLAAQVGLTLTDPDSDEPIEISDNGADVPLPDNGGSEFTAAGFSDFVGPPAPAADVFYLRNGKIIRGGNGSALRGKLDQDSYLFTSIAVSESGAGPALSVAAVSGTGSSTRLIMGTQSAGYRATSLRGPISRPTWAPGTSEVWVGVGGKLYRAPVSGNVAKPAQVSVPSAAGGGRILAVRLSPEGSRIAMVIASAGGDKQLFVGAVVRSAGQVRVDPLQSISPAGVTVTDVAWLGTLKLIAIGSNVSGGDAQIFESNADGALWTGRDIGALPDEPDSVTAAVKQFAWVSTNGTVWEQDGRSWAPAGGSGSQTAGDQPVYLE